MKDIGNDNTEGFPEADMAITTILVVSDMEKSKAFYFDVLGGELYREYGGILPY